MWAGPFFLIRPELEQIDLWYSRHVPKLSRSQAGVLFDFLTCTVETSVVDGLPAVRVSTHWKAAFVKSQCLRSVSVPAFSLTPHLECIASFFGQLEQSSRKAGWARKKHTTDISWLMHELWITVNFTVFFINFPCYLPMGAPLTCICELIFIKTCKHHFGICNTKDFICDQCWFHLSWFYLLIPTKFQKTNLKLHCSQ